jgi:(2R)-ethylmalonyl-CoA mutase
VQEIAYAMSTAIAVLDSVRDSGQVPPERFGEVVARISFFVNAGVRFVEEMCKMRPSPSSGRADRGALRRPDPRHRRFRYGVQVNSLGLTEAQPENNVQRIVLEMLGSPCPRTPAPAPCSCPAWNEALGPAPAVGPAVVAAAAAGARLRDRPARVRRPVHRVGRRRAKVAELVEGARAEMARVQEMGGAVAAVESGYMKGRWSARSPSGAGGWRAARTSSSASTGSQAPSPTR